MAVRPTPLNAARLVVAAAVPMLGAAPLLFADTQLVLLTEFFSMLVLAIMWNVLAGYADIVTVGQHGFVGVGAYAFYGFAVLAGVDPYLSLPLAGLVGSDRRGAGDGPRVPAAHRLPVDRHLGHRRGADVGRWQARGFRRRLRRQSAGRGAAGIRRKPRRPHRDDLLARLSPWR